MSIELQPNSAYSLMDLQIEHERSGTSVVRTAHVGNQRGYNLAVSAMRIPMQLVDHTIVAQQSGEEGDNNYLPGSIVTMEGIMPLEVSRLGGLTSRTEVIDPATGERLFLDEFHVRNLQAAFPDTPIITNTAYIRLHEAISGEVVRIALDVAPHLFMRAVESDGTIQRAASSFASRARQQGVLQLQDDPRHESGVLIPNAVDIVLGFVVEALKYGGDYQIHLSGPDFIRYSKDPELRQTLSLLYDEIRQRATFGSRLPELLRVAIIPATEARYVSANGHSDMLDLLFTILGRQREINAEKQYFFAIGGHKVSDPEAQQFIAETDEALAGFSRMLGVMALDAARELLQGPQDAPFTSQYDVLKHGGLYMAGANVVEPMEELKRIRLKLERAKAAALKVQANG